MRINLFKRNNKNIIKKIKLGGKAAFQSPLPDLAKWNLCALGMTFSRREQPYHNHESGSVVAMWDC